MTSLAVLGGLVAGGLIYAAAKDVCGRIRRARREAVRQRVRLQFLANLAKATRELREARM